MILLLDANLLWRLSKVLEDPNHEVEHVNRVVLPDPASDEKIWEYTRTHGSTIVTKEHDFIRVSETRSTPPPVVIIRRQNMPWRFYDELIRDKLPEIEKAILFEKLALVEIL
jgi:predicted nuclease of predicted toxin-antitoxin system